jgi:chaperonin cofactor prefoldin
LEKELVHKEDYNSTVTAMRSSITEITNTGEEAMADAQIRIVALEKRIDTLREQLSKLQTYISSNYGADQWRVIKKTFNLD